MVNVYKIIDEIKKYKSEYFYLLAFSIFLSLCSDIISRNSVTLSIKWVISNPLYFLTLVVLVISLNIVFVAIISNIKIGSIISGAIILLLSMIHLYKYDLRGTPLIPSDIFLVNEALNITNVFNISKYIFHITFAVLLIILIIFTLNRLNFAGFCNKHKIMHLVIGIIIGVTIVQSNVLAEADYQSKGFLLNYFSLLDNKKNEYDHQLVKEVMKNFKGKENGKGSSWKNSNGKNPNIIVIMNEAFWDLNLLNDVEITPNPMKVFEELKKESIHGLMETPVFAGGTSNVEFEVITGFSTHYFDDGYMLYPNEVKVPFMSLASVLRNQGYKTTAIHPFWGWYYDRNKVYKHLGFEQFISDGYLIKSQLKGYYVSDEVVTDLIIDKIESDDEPQFLFNVTMQNHGPYDDERYNNMKLDVDVKGSLDDESIDILKTYSQGIYDANKALGRLIDYLKNDDEPTILLFFGDHLPLLGENFKVYRDCGYINDSQSPYERTIKSKTTPFMIWSNYEKRSEDIGMIDAIFLGPYLLNQANVIQPNYYKFLLQLFEEMPVINNGFAMDNSGNYISHKEVKYQSYNEKLKAVQLDLMYGKKQIEENYNEWIISDNVAYNRKLNDVKIDNVMLKDDELIINGSNLYPKGRLYISGKEISFDFVDTNQLVVRNYKEKLQHDQLEIQFKLINTIEKVLAETEIYKINIREQ